MAVVLDDRVKAAATISEPIRNQVQVTGFTQNEAEDLALVLETGALPVPLEILSQQAIGASLGEDAIRTGLNAIALGIAAVLLFMLVYYKGAGLVADLALVLNLFFLISVLSVLNFTLTLPSIAGVILTVGMAVDANVIIFERIKEEYRLGKSASAAVTAGFGKAFCTVMDANITTFIAAIALSQLGSGPIQGLRRDALGRRGVLHVHRPGGVAVDLRLLHRNGARAAAQHRLEAKGSARARRGGSIMKRVIPFTNLRLQMEVLSVALIIAGAVGTMLRGGVNLSVDLSGGVAQQFQVAPAALAISDGGAGLEPGADSARSAARASRIPDLAVDAGRHRAAAGARFRRGCDDRRHRRRVARHSRPAGRACRSAGGHRRSSCRRPGFREAGQTLVLGYLDPGAAGEAPIDTVRAALAPLIRFSLQVTGAPGAQRYIVRTDLVDDDAEGGQDQQATEARIFELLAAAFGADHITVQQTDFVGPSFSRVLGEQAVWLIKVAFALIFVYILFRFRAAFAVGALLALIHDIAIMLGVLGVLQLEISTATIAAILTIVGYSLNDTIVIFDRIRENDTLMRDASTELVINTSITQSLSRTVITSAYHPAGGAGDLPLLDFVDQDVRAEPDDRRGGGNLLLDVRGGAHGADLAPGSGAAQSSGGTTGRRPGRQRVRWRSRRRSRLPRIPPRAMLPAQPRQGPPGSVSVVRTQRLRQTRRRRRT